MTDATTQTHIILKQENKIDCFTTIFQHIKAFTQHVNIMFKTDGVYIQSMDTSRVSIFELDLPNTWFDRYVLYEDRPITIGVNSSLLFRILSTRDTNQELHLKYNSQGDSDILYLHFTGENKALYDKDFELPLIDLESETMSIPAVESDVELTISSTNFSNTINQLKLFGDSVEIECNDEVIVLSSTSLEKGKMKVNITTDEMDAYSIVEGKVLKMSYSLTNLHNICLYNKLSKNITIEWKEDFPMKVVYPLSSSSTTTPTEEGPEARMTFYLAPKIQDDD